MAMKALILLKFAVEKGRPDVARVKLLLNNKSDGRLQWVLKCDDRAITVEPTLSGSIEMFESNEVNLTWQRPNTIKEWTNVPKPKMQLFMKLIARESGKVVTNAFTKFKAMINPDTECNINDLPVHEVVIKSEKTPEQMDDKDDFKNGIDKATTKAEDFLEDPDTLFWLIVILCCFLAAVILQSIMDSGHSDSSQ